MTHFDLNEVYSLTKRLRFLNWNMLQFKSELQNTYTYGFVARQENSKFLGYALFHLALDEAELLAIATEPDFFKQGVAKTLYKNAIELLKNNGAETLFLEVREGNLQARAFYEKMGLNTCGRRKSYYSDGESAILYSKSLEFM